MPPGVENLFIALILLLLAKFLVAQSNRPKVKGRIGEKAVELGLWSALDKEEYQRFPDLILPTRRGGLTQIDHVILSPYGLFVVETKDYSGWIFGDAASAKWTVSYRGGRKRQFQNPLRQNFAHVKAVEDWLGVPATVVHGLVFFVGEATFKTEVPDGVLLGGLASRIKSYQDRVFDEATLARLQNRLEEAQEMDSASLRERHLSKVSQRRKR